MFLVFEGIDGSGTTTQVRLLAKKLADAKIFFFQTAEPTDGFLGKCIREILAGGIPLSPRALQMLFCADRAEHEESQILPVLRSEGNIISDRFFLSTLAYSALSGNENLFREIAKFSPEPDCTIFLKIDPQIAFERIEKRGKTKDIFEKKEFLEKIAHAYESEMARIPKEKKMVFDSGKMSIEDIAEEIAQKFLPQMKKKSEH